MSARSRIRIRSRLVLAGRVALAWLVLGSGGLRADDVNLVSGAHFEQAIGGRVRGQVQSESATEVAVRLARMSPRCRPS